ncbi:MAG: DUF2934 domain-containing protein [Nitrospiraceae bacterium]|nr:DUF2934 domain-containing protein [Nitrospiraceae bacterium]
MKPTPKKSRTQRSVESGAGRSGAATVESPDGLWERISQKAYDLWQERGRREGFALEDWLDAEAIVMDEIHEARE